MTRSALDWLDSSNSNNEVHHLKREKTRFNALLNAVHKQQCGPFPFLCVSSCTVVLYHAVWKVEQPLWASNWLESLIQDLPGYGQFFFKDNLVWEFRGDFPNVARFLPVPTDVWLRCWYLR
jgi:hypothetical protein